MTHVTFGDPSAWENPPNPGHGCGFSVGDFESTRTRTRPTHTRVPARVCKPVTGPTHNLVIMFLSYYNFFTSQNNIVRH